MSKIPLRIKLFMQWLQFWAFIGGFLFGVRQSTPDELVEFETKLQKKDGESN